MNAPKCLGRIASFSISTGTGQIISEQGTTIAFNYRDWLGSRTPSAGMRIRYIAGKEGEAHQIEHIPMRGKVTGIAGEMLTIQLEQSETTVCGSLIRWRDTPEPIPGDLMLFDLDPIEGSARNIEFAYSKNKNLKLAPACADLPPKTSTEKPRKQWLIPAAVVCIAFTIFQPHLSLIAIGVLVIVFFGLKEYSEEAELKKQFSTREAAAYELGKRKGYRKGRAKSLFDN